MVNFKNKLEERIYEAARGICGTAVTVEHNKTIEIDVADAIEVAAFAGPPKKEIDVISAALSQNLKLLVSCKDYGSSKADPSDVQEWAAVVRTMNSYSAGSALLGLVVCPSGFTKGCEPWATTHNLGLIPPLKGKLLSFKVETSLEMFRRVLSALPKRLHFPFADLLSPPGFYDFVFSMVSDFEWRDARLAKNGGRYSKLGTGWGSSFQELVSTLMGRSILGVFADANCMGLHLSDNLVIAICSGKILFGAGESPQSGTPTEPECVKNLSRDPCSFEFLKSLVVGQKLRSAGDFGNRFEFGLSNDIILGFYPEMLHVVLARNPIEKNLL